MDRCNSVFCRAAFGEESFVIPGNGHRTAISHTAFQAFVTVVAALFQELGVYCHAIIATRCIWIVCDCYSRNMDINCHCHVLAFDVCDSCDYTIPGNGHSLPCHTLHFGCILVAFRWHFVAFRGISWHFVAFRGISWHFSGIWVTGL